MANYYGMTRTNYFHVKDEQSFRELMEHMLPGDIEVWEDKDADGRTVFAFGGYATIEGYCENPEEDCYGDYDQFIRRLSECIEEGDAVIITEIGNEKLRYFTAYSVVVTSEGSETVDLISESMQKGCEMLWNPDWTTKCEY